MNLGKKYKIVKHKIKMSQTHQLNKFKQIKDDLVNN